MTSRNAEVVSLDAFALARARQTEPEDWRMGEARRVHRRLLNGSDQDRDAAGEAEHRHWLDRYWRSPAAVAARAKVDESQAEARAILRARTESRTRQEARALASRPKPPSLVEARLLAMNCPALWVFHIDTSLIGAGS